MRSAAKKTTMLATAAAIGFSSLFLTAGPATAAPTGCSQGATLLTDNVCELRLTTVGESTFTPTAEMSQLEVLLVAGGGQGTDAANGYGGGGGGGEVKVVGFGESTPPSLDLFVGGSSSASTVTNQGTTTAALPGQVGSFNSEGGNGGASGNGNAGWTYVPGGSAGGGAGASPVDANTGGAGVVVGDIAPDGSLFSDDLDCFGGGGAIGIHSGTFGIASCGGGYMVDGETSATIIAPVANSGGGGAGGTTVLGSDQTARAGASGLVVLRWVEPQEITVTFDNNGHGAAIAPQTFLQGGTATEPATPQEAGFVFNGWFSDAGLKTAADFTTPLTASTTFYASWSAAAVTPAAAAAPTAPVLAATGTAVDPSAVPIGLAALIAGLGLVIVRARRTRAE
jgi:uncharacterized repeat protein (TIGR02543 family)